ncbi:MAG: hypothetical protein JXC32_10400 [Anaerolineae bacterium]|nr:hypothetical protein [Anaerolineae bacterium]
MLIGAIVLTIVGGVWLFARNPRTPAGQRPTAVVETTTPTPVPTRGPTRTPESAQPDTIGVGARVLVVDTGNAGLSMRTEASTAGERVDVVQEGETLLVVGGPEEADGYTWWFVRDELNSAREGWAVEDFLAPTD